jgi:hypothetical protein
VAKVTINGEVFDWDPSRKPMSEALAIENGLKCRYVDWEEDLQKGSARALAGFVWLVWRRDGRTVDLQAILNGDVEIDLAGLSVEGDGDEDPGPTGPPLEPSPMTDTAIRQSSPASSG